MLYELFMAACTLVAASQFTDAYTTLVGIKDGATESNSIVKPLLSHPALLYLVKIGIVSPFMIMATVWRNEVSNGYWYALITIMTLASGIGWYALYNNLQAIKGLKK